MAVTVGKLAVVLRIQDDATAAVAEPHMTILADLLKWARAEVAAQAPRAPEDSQDQAIYTLCGYVYDVPTAARGTAYANAWDNSGAKHILRRWITRRAVLLTREDPDEVEAPAGQVAITREQALTLIAQALAELRMSDGTFTIEQVQAIITAALSTYATLNAVDMKIAAHAAVAEAHQQSLTENEVSTLITTAIAAYHQSEGIDDVDRATVLKLIEEHAAIAEAHQTVQAAQLTLVHYEARALGRVLLEVAADGTVRRPLPVRDEWEYNSGATGRNPVLYWKGPAQTPMGLWVVGSNDRRTFMPWGDSGVSGASIVDQSVLPAPPVLPGADSEIIIYGARETAATARWGVRALFRANPDGDDAPYSIKVYEAAAPAIPSDLPFTIQGLIVAKGATFTAPNLPAGTGISTTTEVLTTGGLDDERLAVLVPKDRELIGASVNIEVVPSAFEFRMTLQVDGNGDPVLFKATAAATEVDHHLYLSDVVLNIDDNSVTATTLPAPGRIRFTVKGLSLGEGQSVDEAMIKLIVDRAIAAHAGVPTAHQNAGITTAQAEALIAAHTAIPEAHQAPGLSMAAVETLIATHAADADAHQTIPPPGPTATEVATLINTAIATHTAIATAHQQPGLNMAAVQALIDASIAKIPASSGGGLFELERIGSVRFRGTGTQGAALGPNFPSSNYTFENTSGNAANWSNFADSAKGIGFKIRMNHIDKVVAVLVFWNIGRGDFGARNDGVVGWIPVAPSGGTSRYIWPGSHFGFRLDSDVTDGGSGDWRVYLNSIVNANRLFSNAGQLEFQEVRLK